MSPACVRMDVDVDTLEFRGRVGTGKKQKIAASCGQVQPPSRRSSSLIRAGKNGTAGAQDRITGSYRNSKVLLSSPNSDHPNERSGRSIEELRFAITRKDFLARADVALSKEQNQLEACSFEEKKNRHLGCLHPVGHFRHARRHVALLPPAVVLLATSPFLDDP
ncbi:hypothetical protein HZH66_008374 [Vespula vulgaris]|uniref:Uncharacterized protein n=1 Tax=Vespula vulgaris TaxID=7454 RepID=A0A834JQ53_VESVU|nr:hypothetical protein HZH66_008374 [Vespula vulgaris]